MNTSVSVQKIQNLEMLSLCGGSDENTFSRGKQAQ
jgi:hypothetical protein